MNWICTAVEAANVLSVGEKWREAKKINNPSQQSINQFIIDLMQPLDCIRVRSGSEKLLSLIFLASM